MEINTLFYPFYGMLSGGEQSLYRQLLRELGYGRKEILPEGWVRPDQAKKVWDAIMLDRPEIFWVNSGFRFKVQVDQVISISPKYNSCAADIPGCRRRMERAIREFTAGLDGMSAVHREKAIHDRMVSQISYIHHDLDQTAFAALVEKKAVCAGYSRAFQLLMQTMGIPCYYCEGRAKGKDSKDWVNHAWNIVRLGDDFYNIDITWNDCYDHRPENYISYDYFNCTDRQIALNHIRTEQCSRLPACSGTKMSFRGVTGVEPQLDLIYQDGVTSATPVRSERDFYNLVAHHLGAVRSGRTQLSFPAFGEPIRDNYMAWLEKILAGLYPRGGYSVQTERRDYKNGWYRIKIEVEFR